MSKKHVKPTTEELEENAQRIAAELEQETPPVIPQEPVKEPEKTEEKKEEIKEEPEEAEKEEKPVEKEDKEQVDYKKKFIESTREAQILHAKNKKINDAFEEAQKIPTPDDEQMQKEYVDWDLMSEFEKKMAKDSYISRVRFESLSKVTAEFKDLEVWQERVENFIGDPKTLINKPELEGKQEEFRLFANKPSRRGVDFDTLVSSFLWDENKAMSSKPKNKGSMFETGTGGPNDNPQPKPDKISIEEARVLRQSDYGKWKEYLKAGKIEDM